MAHLPIKSSSVKKIAVLRANALGDFIFSIPALAALRQAYPKAEIVYLGQEWHANFIPGRIPYVDRVIVVPDYPGVSKPDNYIPDRQVVESFFAAMRLEEFDIAIQLHGGGRNSNPFVKRLGARFSVGTHADNAPPLDCSVPYTFHENVTMRLLEVVSKVGAVCTTVTPHINLALQDYFEADDMLRERHVERPYIVIHPGSTTPLRRWSTVNFARVAEHFMFDGYEVVVVGVPNEESIIDDIILRTGGRAKKLLGISLGGLGAVMAGADLLIANDSGPLHLAGAVGTPTIGIYWIGFVLTSAPLTRSNHLPCVSWCTNCPICGKSAVATGFPFDGSYCGHEVSYVNEISVGEVLGAASRLLNNTKRRAGRKQLSSRRSRPKADAPTILS